MLDQPREGVHVPGVIFVAEGEEPVVVEVGEEGAAIKSGQGGVISDWRLAI
jgi:hypothetical protein